MPIVPIKPFAVPDGYDADNLKKGFEACTSLRKPKALVDMANGARRDNIMYEHLDNDYMSTIKKQRRQRNFTLADYLPNSMKRDNSSTAISNEATSVGTYPMGTRDGPPNSRTLNRLASLSELNDSLALGSASRHNRLATLEP